MKGLSKERAVEKETQNNRTNTVGGNIAERGRCRERERGRERKTE